MNRCPTFVIACVLLLAPRLAQCEPPAPFALDPNREWIFLGSGAAMGITSLLLTAQVNGLTPEEIARLDLNDVNHFDRTGVEGYRTDPAGDVLLAASYAIPLTLLGAADCRRDWQILTVMWAETTLFNLGAGGIVKTTVRRPRPYVYDAQTPADVKADKKARFSFYSGHTSQTAANCFFAARVYSSYGIRRRAKFLVWTGTVLYPAVAGIMRIDSGHHFRTDVLTGYCIGAMIGYLVPELHRVKVLRSLQPETLEGGLGVGLRYSH